MGFDVPQPQMAGQGLGSPVQTGHGHLPPYNIMGFLSVSPGERRQEERKYLQKPSLPSGLCLSFSSCLLAPQKLILSVYKKVNSVEGGSRAMISRANEAAAIKRSTRSNDQHDQTELCPPGLSTPLLLFPWRHSSVSLPTAAHSPHHF